MPDHVGKGRVFKSPLAATGVLSVENWVKDDLPDLLWPVLVMEELGNDSYRLLVGWQKRVQDALAHHDDVEWIAETLDGRLSQLEVLAGRFPDAVAIVVREAEFCGLLSEGVRGALSSYPHMPARWLVQDIEPLPPQQQDIEFIRDALLGVLADNHREALLKCLRTWSTVYAGSFRSNGDTIELLKGYPQDVASRGIADATVRAMWGAHKAVVQAHEPGHFEEAIKWARVFWGTNSMTTRCIRRREAAVDESDEESQVLRSEAAVDESGTTEPTSMPEDGKNLRRFTIDILSSFVEALETAPAHLHSNERQEVVSGLVVRAGRDLIAVLGAPDLWCLEHGAHIGRMLVETKIYLHWMALQEPGVYRQYQEYGAGKAKLYSRIAEELPDDARTAGFRESVDELKRLSHNNEIIDHRVVDTRDSFAGGKSIRAMAEEAGLLDLYRQAYSLASGVSHSEWWSVEVNAMEPCLNVLHGMHMIPNMSLNYGGNVELATSWVDQLYSLIRAGLQILRTDESAVDAAFAWLDDADGREPTG